MLQAIALGVYGVLAPVSSGAKLDRDGVRARSRSSMRRLQSFLDVALLDDGDELELDAIVKNLGVDELVSLRVWTHRLGHAARPPRPLAFRWLSNRWGLRPSECLYVPGTEPLAIAARSAGWCVSPRPVNGFPDLETLVERLDSGARPWET